MTRRAGSLAPLNLAGGPRSAAGLGALVAACALLAGCGAPPPDTVRPIDPTAVPYALLSPAPADEQPVELDGQVKTTPRLYLVDPRDRLVTVPVTVDATGLEAVARQLLDQLDDGPTESQRQTGLASALGPGTVLSLTEITAGTARVDLALSRRDPAADRLPLATGQIVLSLTSVAGIERVQLFRDGQALEIALPGGARTTAPVTAEDYHQLVAPGQPPVEKAEPGPSPTPSAASTSSP